jgi:hypothetical protein
MTTFKWFASLVLAATIVPALAAKTHCPGNAASVTPSWHAGNSFLRPISAIPDFR